MNFLFIASFPDSIINFRGALIDDLIARELEVSVAAPKMDKNSKVLDSIGMPSRRTIFVDSWYVPIEEYVDRKWLENYLSKKYSKIFRVDDTGDININSMSNLQYSKEIWGDGELRYFISK